MTCDQQKREELIQSLAMIRDYLKKRLGVLLDENRMSEANAIAAEVGRLNCEIAEAEANP